MQDQKAKAYLHEVCKDILTPVEIKMWINPLYIESSNSTLKIFVKSEFIKEYFRKPKFSKIFSKLSELCSAPYEIVVGKERTENFTPKTSTKKAILQPQLRFFKTSENENAIRALRFFVQNDIRILNIHGKSGVGKTEIVKLFASKGSLKVYDTRDFVKECFNEIDFKNPDRNKQVSLFSEKIVILDNFDAIVNKNIAQDKLCYLFDKFQNRKFIFLSQKKSSELKVSESLKNRIRLGLQVEIKPPSRTTLHEIAGLMNLKGEFSDMIDLFYTAKSDKFDFVVKKNSARGFVQEFCKTNNLTVKKIKSAKYKHTKTQLIIRMRELGFTVRDIADSLELKSHGTVIYAIKKHEQEHFDESLTEKLTTVSSAVSQDSQSYVQS